MGNHEQRNWHQYLTDQTRNPEGTHHPQNQSLRWDQITPSVSPPDHSPNSPGMLNQRQIFQQLGAMAWSSYQPEYIQLPEPPVVSSQPENVQVIPNAWQSSESSHPNQDVFQSSIATDYTFPFPGQFEQPPVLPEQTFSSLFPQDLSAYSQIPYDSSSGPQKTDLLAAHFNQLDSGGTSSQKTFEQEQAHRERFPTHHSQAFAQVEAQEHAPAKLTETEQKARDREQQSTNFSTGFDHNQISENHHERQAPIEHTHKSNRSSSDYLVPKEKLSELVDYVIACKQNQTTMSSRDFLQSIGVSVSAYKRVKAVIADADHQEWATHLLSKKLSSHLHQKIFSALTKLEKRHLELNRAKKRVENMDLPKNKHKD